MTNLKKSLLSLLLVCSLTLQGCIYSISYVPQQMGYHGSELPEPTGISLKYNKVREFVQDKECFSKRSSDSYERIFNLFMNDLMMFEVVDDVRDSDEPFLLYEERIYSSFSEIQIFLYSFFLGAISMVTPLPVPLFFDVDWEIKLKAVVKGREVVVRRYEDSFEWKVWSASLWGALVSMEKLERGMADYQMERFGPRFIEDADLYKRLSELMLNGEDDAILDLVNANSQL